jgi:hypothetical protein
MTKTDGSDIRNINDLVESQKALESLGAVHIGNICSWDVSNDVALTHPEYKDKARSLGIPDDYLVEEKSPLAAFSKAWKNAHKPKGLKATELKHTRNEGDLLMIAFYEQEGKGADLSEAELEIKHKITLSFHKKDFSIEAVPKSSEYMEDAASLLSEVKRQFDKFMNITQEDLQATSAAFCRSAGIPTQPRGGSYFIPREHDATVEAFREFYGAVSLRSLFLATPVYSSPSSNADLGKAAVKSLLADIEQIDLDVFQVCLTKGTCEYLHQAFQEAIAHISDLPSVKTILAKCRVHLTFSLQTELDDLIASLVNLSNQEITDKVKAIASKVVAKDKLRNQTIANRLEEVKVISNKVMQFQDYLGARADGLTDTLEHLNTYLETLYEVKNGTTYEDDLQSIAQATEAQQMPDPWVEPVQIPEPIVPTPAIQPQADASKTRAKGKRKAKPSADESPATKPLTGSPESLLASTTFIGF